MVGIGDDVVAAARVLVERDGPGALVVDDLRRDDLPLLGWSGSDLHVESVAAALRRATVGELDYLVARTPTGEPIAKGGVDFAHPDGPGALWQLATHPSLQSLGIGARLVGALEDRARSRGLERTWLGVEVDNPRAAALYERLGYEAYGEQDDGWHERSPDGRTVWYATRVTLMERRL